MRGNQIQEGSLPVEGGRVWYRLTGKDKPGIPLLTVHGGPGAAHDYLEPLEALADERPVIFYDQLDCGNSERPDRPELWTVERYVEELHQVRSALGLERVFLLGQSWGVVPAVEYALKRRGEGMAGLVLSGPLLSSSRWAADQKTYIAELPVELRTAIEKAEASGDFAAEEYGQAAMEYCRRHVCRLNEWPECMDRTFAKLNVRLYQYMWGPSEFTVRGTLKDYDCVDRLGEINVPVLFTCGEFDEAAPDTVRFFQRRTPGSELRVFEGASHEHHLEKPEKYLAAVRDFLNRK